MSYHISTYGYTHKMFGCKWTRLDLGETIPEGKNKECQGLLDLGILLCT